jgi:hypothetical protein
LLLLDRRPGAREAIDPAHHGFSRINESLMLTRSIFNLALYSTAFDGRHHAAQCIDAN